MKQEDVVKAALALPLTSPTFPPGPYRFFYREFFTNTHRTDPALLRKVAPAPPWPLGQPPPHRSDAGLGTVVHDDLA